jgi:hypothetical protein
MATTWSTAGAFASGLGIDAGQTANAHLLEAAGERGLRHRRPVGDEARLCGDPTRRRLSPSECMYGTERVDGSNDVVTGA